MLKIMLALGLLATTAPAFAQAAPVGGPKAGELMTMCLTGGGTSVTNPVCKGYLAGF